MRMRAVENIPLTGLVALEDLLAVVAVVVVVVGLPAAGLYLYCPATKRMSKSVCDAAG